MEEIEKFMRHIGCLKEANTMRELRKKLLEIYHNSYNDIDYFNRDMRKDLEEIIERFYKIDE